MSAREKSATERKSILSDGSRASINVTLPLTGSLDAQSPVMVRALSPGKNQPQEMLPNPAAKRVYPSARSQIPTPNKPTIYEHQQLENMYAAHVIERAWTSYQDKQMFKLLKHAVCAAENSLSLEILKKVCPKEAELLKDKFMQCKVRFRFGGMEFPPNIYFKIYAGSGKAPSINYVSGKKMIKPASEAAKDACDRMGHRKFYDQMIQDMIQHQKHRITDEVDITTLKDYMQYMSLLDETPSYMGGRENTWRKLTLDVLPRQTIFYDIVDYLYNHRMSQQLLDEMPVLLANPSTEDVQLEQINIISQLRPVTPSTPKALPKSRYVPPATDQGPVRRSRQARSRASKMRQVYEQGFRQKTAQTTSDVHLDGGVKAPPQSRLIPLQNQVSMTQLPADEDWEDEADKLYEWTQELSFDELLTTPRLGTASNQCGISY